MEINGENGILLVKKYLTGKDLERKANHSLAVGNLCARVAKRISKLHPEYKINIERLKFLGYTHDLGYAISYDDHERLTVNILINEGIDPAIAKMTMHGHLAEEFGPEYLPVGTEGEILTFCDMSVNVGQPTTVQERANEIIQRISLVLTIPKEKRAHIVKYLLLALPRFKSYEKKILALGQVQNVNEF